MYFVNGCMPRQTYIVINKTLLFHFQNQEIFSIKEINNLQFYITKQRLIYMMCVRGVRG